MGKLKGTKAILKVVNEFTQSFGIKAVWGEEFIAMPSDMKIRFTVVIDNALHKCFLEDCERRFPEVHAHIFLWLLMHEIGHCMTTDAWEVDDTWYFLKAKKKLRRYIMNGSDDIDTITYHLNEIYHAFPDEFLATKWAGEYMGNHPKKMQKFNKKLNKAMIKFIQKNSIE